MTNIIKEVNNEIDKVIKKNKKELDTALIKPIHKQHPFSSNGLYCFLGKPGSGKTYYILKHILLSEKLFEKPYYSLIVFCSTSLTHTSLYLNSIANLASLGSFACKH